MLRPPLSLVAAGACVFVLIGAGCAHPANTRPPEQQARLNELAAWIDQADLSATLWQQDQSRLYEDAARCPGPSAPLTPSPAQKLRDSLRVEPWLVTSQRLAETPGREARLRASDALLEALHQTARADWFLRRAAQDQDARHCVQAREALEAAEQSMTAMRARVDEARQIVRTS